MWFNQSLLCFLSCLYPCICRQFFWRPSGFSVIPFSTHRLIRVCSGIMLFQGQIGLSKKKIAFSLTFLSLFFTILWRQLHLNCLIRVITWIWLRTSPRCPCRLKFLDKPKFTLGYRLFHQTIKGLYSLCGKTTDSRWNDKIYYSAGVTTIFVGTTKRQTPFNSPKQIILVGLEPALLLGWYFFIINTATGDISSHTQTRIPQECGVNNKQHILSAASSVQCFSYCIFAEQNSRIGDLQINSWFFF